MMDTWWTYASDGCQALISGKTCSVLLTYLPSSRIADPYSFRLQALVWLPECGRYEITDSSKTLPDISI